MDENDPIEFKYSNYEYKVNLGIVTSMNTINWESHISANRWKDVKEIVNSWDESKKYPVVEITTHYKK